MELTCGHLQNNYSPGFLQQQTVSTAPWLLSRSCTYLPFSASSMSSSVLVWCASQRISVAPLELLENVQICRGESYVFRLSPNVFAPDIIFKVQRLTPSPHSKKVMGLILFQSGVCLFLPANVGSLWVLWFPHTVQKHACEANWVSLKYP